MAAGSARLRDAPLAPCGKATPSVDVRKGSSVVGRSNGSNRPQAPFHRRSLGLRFLGFLPPSTSRHQPCRPIALSRHLRKHRPRPAATPPISRCRECPRARFSTKSRRPESSQRSYDDVGHQWRRDRRAQAAPDTVYALTTFDVSPSATLQTAGGREGRPSHRIANGSQEAKLAE
jgi:hypothetical protein